MIESIFQRSEATSKDSSSSVPFSTEEELLEGDESSAQQCGVRLENEVDSSGR
jgi:hypothetical protein